MAKPMDRKIVRRLEKELLKAIADVIARIGLRGLPLLPSHRTLEMMAKAAVAVYEGAVARPAARRLTVSCPPAAIPSLKASHFSTFSCPISIWQSVVRRLRSSSRP